MTVKKLKLKGLIYARYDDYANRLASGWMQQMIVDELKEEGYVLTTNYFSRCFSDARSKKLLNQTAILISEKAPAEPEPKPSISSPVKKEGGGKSKFSIPVVSDDEMF